MTTKHIQNNIQLTPIMFLHKYTKGFEVFCTSQASQNSLFRLRATDMARECLINIIIINIVIKVVTEIEIWVS